MFMYIAEDVEKQWSALRNMFSREERKKVSTIRIW